MPSGTIIPAETDLLCENCGYVLNGLPAGVEARCPECGRPVAQSSPELRALSAWEQAETKGFAARLATLLRTSAAVLFRPTHFYRTLATRGGTRMPLLFAQVHWALSSILIGWAAYTHYRWFISGLPGSPFSVAAYLLLVVLTYVFLFVTTRIAAWLTHWEASYRGLRLPRSVVERGMYYHAVHYLPVALGAAATVAYQVWLMHGWAGLPSTTTYLYVLCGEVVVGALYLFWTYWIGMRNMMYANA